MALRPIDNALPITTPERPKNQTKVLIATQKQPEIGVNDENQVPLPPSADATIDYVPSEKLKSLPDPETKIQGLMEELESKDWIKVVEALNNARRFALFHSSLLEPILEKVICVAVKAMKNPRSALCKTSIMASSDIFKTFGDMLLAFTTEAFDNLLLQLLLKASQDKRFVCEEADRALNAMVTSMNPLSLLHKLRSYASHGNPRVRAKAAVSASNSVSKLGLEDMEVFGLVSLVQVAAKLLNDRLPEAREAARSIVISTYEAYMGKAEQNPEAWQDFCQSNLPPIDAHSIIKITSSRVMFRQITREAFQALLM